MFKVLLIDDEPLIREGLRQVIEWERYGFTICDVGLDGRDGLNKIRIHQPEVVIIDIRMPGMSGIEVIEKAKQEGYTCKFIVLSGYSSFSYAKQSIKLGIESYLLKPIDEDELVAILAEIKTALTNDKKIHTQLTQYQQLSEEQRWKSVIEGRADDRQIQNLMEISPDHFHLAVLHADEDMKKQEIKEILKPYETQKVKLIWKDRAIYLLCISCEEQEVIAYLTLFNDKIQELVTNPIKGYLANSFQSLSEIGLALRQIDQIDKLAYCFGDTPYLTYSILDNERIAEPDYNQISSIIIRSLEFKDRNKLEEQSKVLIRYYQLAKFEKSRIQAEMIEFVSEIMKEMSKTYQDLQIGEKEPFVKQVYQTNNIQELFNVIELRLWLLAKQINGFSLSAEDNMKKILNYTQQYYYQDLNLKVLANLFNYNSSYLGKKFKIHTGEHFHTYLDKIRIAKAKQLLVKQDYKVYKVSDLVGYSNMDYFYKKFKKHVGMSPKEYQKESRKERSIL
ncbi:response regulator transcription factor [Paraliobacillus zengyii]|uniref:response regulator transcription factor n=1 Tax=Paraliobacillus zengyii TaxID=2213194 RepID=UPI000E3B90F6|nr:response regulator [Paraliobacillus zengyii]